MVTLEKEIAVLGIPEMFADDIIALYPSSLFAGHQGVIKTYLTINDNFYTQSNTVLMLLYKRMSHIPINPKRKTAK